MHRTRRRTTLAHASRDPTVRCVAHTIHIARGARAGGASRVCWVPEPLDCRRVCASQWTRKRFPVTLDDTPTYMSAHGKLSLSIVVVWRLAVMGGRWHRRPPVEDAAFLLNRLEPAPN